MDSSKTLFTTLNALIFVIILAIIGGLLLTILSISGVYTDSIVNNDISFSDLGWTHYLFMALNLIVYSVFIYGLFRLRIVSKLFLNNTFYNSELGKNSNLTGKCFILSGVFWWLIDGLSSIHFNNEFSIGVSEKTFIYLFIIVIGLFFMLISRLFDKALELKNENDLTI
jgi:hypothetical protein